MECACYDEGRARNAVNYFRLPSPLQGLQGRGVGGFGSEGSSLGFSWINHLGKDNDPLQGQGEPCRLNIASLLANSIGHQEPKMLGRSLNEFQMGLRPIDGLGIPSYILRTAHGVCLLL